ncbi:MAG: hypothetical protein ACJ8R9_09495 [Steroidobacteraceae bacterium]
MKRTFSIGLAAIWLAGLAAATGTVTEGLTSTKEHGVVSVMSDPTLAEGRLVLKVVAMNRTQISASFGPQDVKVFTAAGTAVKLMSLDQLIAEARAAADSDPGSMARNPTVHSGPMMHKDASGRPDVSGYTGGNDTMNGINMSQGRMGSGRAATGAPQLQQQIAGLNAAILHDVTIAPAAVTGGQIVTEKLKFARNEGHNLHLVVDFNGEQHEFDFAAPPQR